MEVMLGSMPFRYELHGWRFEQRGLSLSREGGFTMGPGVETVLLRMRAAVYFGVLIGCVLLTALLVTRLMPRYSEDSAGRAGLTGEAKIDRPVEALERNLPARAVQELARRQAERDGRHQRLRQSSERRRAMVWWLALLLCTGMGVYGPGHQPHLRKVSGSASIK